MSYVQSTDPRLTVAGLPTASAMPGVEAFARFVGEGLAQPIVAGFRQAAANLFETLGVAGRTSTWGSSKPGKTRDCCDTPTDPCHCRCCIVDADLVVYGRLGERRVVPLTVENRWRRERKIKMELSAFSARGGGASPVTGELLPPAPEFTLLPCGQQAVVLVIQSTLPSSPAPKPDRPNESHQTRALPDVDDCLVSYADLRVEGCEIRPLRMAVALLPRDCADYRIICRCECC